MAEEKPNSPKNLEAGTYELLRSRIVNNSQELNATLDLLNEERKNVFGTIETKVLATERITTSNNCIPWDMFSFGSKFIFGYNVHVGLRSEVKISDVFSFYEYSKDKSFHELEVDSIIKDKSFLDDFHKLYKYYKHAHFLRFASIGPFLYMVFRAGNEVTDVKTFKWELKGEKLKYVDNRSDHEYKFPFQHEFEWKRTRREDFRDGAHPHISIKDRVFVECVNGDLTVKIEDNTDNGVGIYREVVENKLQTLDDSEFQYAEVGNLILIKAKPYQEDDRYLIFNEKLHEVKRIDAIKEACILLPDGQGLIFSNGYYLQSGEYKLFDLNLKDMLFERRITSINGEDYAYIFYNREKGIYLILNYNIISQKVENPLVCHGFTIFENGEMCVFKADEEPKKHHSIQIWQTPFTGPNFQSKEKSDSFLQKIGNKDVVRAMAECHEIINLVNREEIYGDLYLDVIKKSTDILDSYHWLKVNDKFNLTNPLTEIRKVAESAVDEYEKARKIRESSLETLQFLQKVTGSALKKSKASFGNINAYVDLLGEIRAVRGEVISAKDLRYIDQASLSSLDEELASAADVVSESCVRFLMQEHALKPFQETVVDYKSKIEVIQKVVEADELIQHGEKIASELDLLIETVSNLKITDATQTTRIIENISDIYASYNQVKGALSNKRKSLLSDEGKAEFSATIKLLEQSVTNYLDICDTPEQCQEYLIKLIVQVEDLEGKFSEFDEFLEQIAQKREEVYNAFEARKLYLTEQRNKKSNQLFGAAERVLSAIRNKAGSLKSKDEVNGYFASDLMVEKIRSISTQLVEMEDTIKADDLASQLKTIKEDILRQLKDKQELFTEGDNIITMGGHKFYINSLALDLSMVIKNKTPHFHLAGTDFFEAIEDDKLEELSFLWDQSLVSENKEVYRAEFLAYSIFLSLNNNEAIIDIAMSTDEYINSSEKDQIRYIQKVMTTRYQDGYIKGIHEYDTHLILNHLLEVSNAAGVVKYSAKSRALASFFWNSCLKDDQKELLNNQIKAAAIILSVFPNSREYEGIIGDILSQLKECENDFYKSDAKLIEVASYLFDELTNKDIFTVSSLAGEFYQSFSKYLKKNKAESKFQKSISPLIPEPALAIRMIQKWLNAYLNQHSEPRFLDFVDEVAVLLFYKDYSETRVKNTTIQVDIEGLKGDHGLIEDGNYTFHLNRFLGKMYDYAQNVVPQFESLQSLKKSLSAEYKSELRLNEFKPRVLSSFVRNQLIDKVYFPLIGANLAKQIGTAGDNKRTDLMGLLLLVSPPGYGKTTLMEYIASRLGVIFMKINGPAIGHEVTSLDPADASNSAAAEELQKLNLSFEMGNNVMIYLDDIQHCNPEFLQKFISMCDAQRKIEGIYKGKTKTYDFRGKKVCVVMAGNPYTESGDKFQIPDMLANRADIYNLGDVIGDSEAVFKLSYIENSLTSNSILSRLASKNLDDVQAVIKMAEKGSAEGLKFEGNHTAEELQEYVAVIKHLFTVRDVILAVNMLYIQSAAMSDENRVEPAFRLQGSYRDMNKMVEKILPLMNAAEVNTVIQSHYENESQTLTSNAEANLLKFKHLTKSMKKEDEKRWKLIIDRFSEKQKQMGYGQNAQMVEGIGDIADNLKGILDNLKER